MACVYSYKNHIFKTEEELDDFILDLLPFESKYGDLVFQVTKEQVRIIDQIEQINTTNKELKEKAKEWRKNNKYIYGEDGEMTISDPPYIGVTSFLSGLKNSKGELLFPEFREKEYWEREFQNWENGKFSDSEIEEFGINKDNPPKIIDRAEQEKKMNQMKNRWKNQAEIGTAIHNVFQIIFQKDGDNYNFTKSENDLKLYILKNLENKNKKFITDKVLDNTIKYALEFKEKLVKELNDDNLQFYTELQLAQDATNPETGKTQTLFGVIDLLIVDSKGRCHILDYKTSVHNYADFGAAKKYAYSYQIATYQRMLERQGINSYEGKLFIAPVHLLGFKKNGNDYSIDGIDTESVLINQGLEMSQEKVLENIEDFMPAPFSVNIGTKDISETDQKFMSSCFKDYSDSRIVDEKSTIKFLKDRGLLTPDENGLYRFYKHDKNAPIETNSEESFVKQVTTYFKTLPKRRLVLTGQIKDALKKGMKDGYKSMNLPSIRYKDNAKDLDWLQDMLKKYCDGNWEIVDKPEIEGFGLIMLKTKGEPKQIDFLRVCTNNLTENYTSYMQKDNPLRSRTGLTGAFQTDIEAISKGGNIRMHDGFNISEPKTLMAEATNGNIELMEAMAIINCLTGLEGHIIGRIQAVNPVYGNGMSLSNEQLMYCFSELTKLDPTHSIQNNRFDSGELKLATKYEIAKQDFKLIMSAAENNDYKDEYAGFQKFKSAVPAFLSGIDGSIPQKIEALQKILDKLNSDRIIGQKLQRYSKRISENTEAHRQLYNDILIAIAQLKGVNFRQQIADNSRWVESIRVWEKGLYGTNIDNPGNMKSETLNSIQQLLKEAYQNTRNEMQKFRTQAEEQFHNFKKSLGFSRLKQNTIGNQTKLYVDFYKETENGDLLFKTENELQDESQKKLLRYALDIINHNRYPLKSEKELEQMRIDGDYDYYKVPLLIGDRQSRVAIKGLTYGFRDFLKNLNPHEAYRRTRQKLEGLGEDFEKADRDATREQELYFKMTNMFDEGEDYDRLAAIARVGGVQNIERNLETILFKHQLAYSIQRNVDQVFPIIKAATVSLTMDGNAQNTSFDETLNYIEEFIKNKIQNKSIVNPKYRIADQILRSFRGFASKMTLAMAPVQLFYQPLQGLWQSISLYIRKPDGSHAFTISNLAKAYKIAYSDLAHFSENPSFCQLINQTFGLNDMDINDYNNRISESKRGMWNMESLMMKFSQRPDYYNRLVIFLSQMMGDGCLDAYSIEDGQLKYDWKKDKRFNLFANGLRKNSAEYNKQKALYYSMAKQFVNEHAKTADGKDFEINMENPMALPSAYTVQQAESYKSLADDIYGYYSHENKSLMQSTLVGALWMQFKTYWSGKKNQYLAPGGIKMRGSWQQYEENGKKYYYQVDNSGNILFDKPLTTDETSAPYMVWKGQWQEGIVLTLSEFAKNAIQKKSIKDAWTEMWNNDNEMLRNVHRSNIKQLGYDLFMFAVMGNIIAFLLGGLLDDQKKKARESRNIKDGLLAAALNVSVMSAKNSFSDLNFFSSIGNPIYQWTPFVGTWGEQRLKTVWKVAIHDEDFWDGVVNTSGALRQIKPLLDTIKPDMFRTESEGGTFNAN